MEIRVSIACIKSVDSSGGCWMWSLAMILHALFPFSVRNSLIKRCHHNGILHRINSEMNARVPQTMRYRVNKQVICQKDLAIKFRAAVVVADGHSNGIPTHTYDWLWWFQLFFTLAQRKNAWASTNNATSCKSNNRARAVRRGGNLQTPSNYNKVVSFTLKHKIFIFEGNVKCYANGFWRRANTRNRIIQLHICILTLCSPPPPML